MSIFKPPVVTIQHNCGTLDMYNLSSLGGYFHGESRGFVDCNDIDTLSGSKIKRCSS